MSEIMELVSEDDENLMIISEDEDQTVIIVEEAESVKEASAILDRIRAAEDKTIESVSKIVDTVNIEFQNVIDGISDRVTQIENTGGASIASTTQRGTVIVGAGLNVETENEEAKGTIYVDMTDAVEEGSQQLVTSGAVYRSTHTPATSTELGSVKIKSDGGIDVADDGSISAKLATKDEVGSIKAGDGLDVDNGVLSVSKRRVLCIGDSYLARSSLDGRNIADSWADRAQFILGDDWIIEQYGVGGAGFIPAIGNTAFSQMISTSYETYGDVFDTIIFGGGYNDGGNNNQSIDTVTYAIGETLALARRLFTNVRRIYLAHFGRADDADHNDGIEYRRHSGSQIAWNRCGEFGACYVSGSEDWLKNHNLYSGDGVHPNQEGEYIIGNGIANALVGLPYTPLDPWVTVNAVSVNNVNITSTPFLKYRRRGGDVDILILPNNITFSAITLSGSTNGMRQSIVIGLDSVVPLISNNGDYNDVGNGAVSPNSIKNLFNALTISIVCRTSSNGSVLKTTYFQATTSLSFVRKDHNSCDCKLGIFALDLNSTGYESRQITELQIRAGRYLCHID